MLKSASRRQSARKNFTGAADQQGEEEKLFRSQVQTFAGARSPMGKRVEFEIGETQAVGVTNRSAPKNRADAS